MDSFQQQAQQMISSLSQKCLDPENFNSFSHSVYDTAWVSMVRKERNGESEFLFPEAFDYLLQTQLPDGSWPSYSSIIDGILNTLAALLATKVWSHTDTRTGLEERCIKAEGALHRMMNKWDLHSTDRVGFEILVPALLRLLENEGLRFDFVGRDRLVKLGEAKMTSLHHVIIGETQTTLLHSLEAFVGILNFDDVTQHQLANGSMLNSPSSTAAYLMNCSLWNARAERYLRTVLGQSATNDQARGVPSAYPTPVFELAWAITSLLQSGPLVDDRSSEGLNVIAKFLETTLEQQKGLIGFAPSCLPDADDTAKTISALSMMKRAVNVRPMISEFEREAHFITYVGERNHSFSANCNVLLCILQSGETIKYTSQIFKCATYIDDAWRTERAQDKWNTSQLYSTMLVAQAFTGLLRAWGSNNLEMTTNAELFVRTRLPVTLLDIYTEVICLQEANGSWEFKHEVTAYAILTLSSLLELPWKESIRTPGLRCVDKGKTYLLQNRHAWACGDPVWIEKVAYSSTTLSQAYCLVASHIPIERTAFADAIDQLFSQSARGLIQYASFFTNWEPFSSGPTWKMEVSLMQSVFFFHALKESGPKIVPSMEKTKNHKYLEYIPFTWIGCKYFLGSGLSLQILWEMMIISMLGFQIDAYIETVVAEEFSGKLEQVQRIIDQAFDEASPPRLKRPTEDSEEQRHQKLLKKEAEIPTTNGSVTFERAMDSNAASPGPSLEISNNSTETTLALHDDRPATNTVEGTIRALRKHVLAHPVVLLSPIYLRTWLSHSLRSYLHSHITHLEDSHLLSQGLLPTETYHHWVHTTSADSTSCPYSFVFYLCLLHGSRSQPGAAPKNLFSDVKARYFLEDVCRHLATMCRQQNDFGSVERDRADGDLNSVNFPEFQDMSGQHGKRAVVTETTKVFEERANNALLELSGYEKRCLEAAMTELERCVAGYVMEELQLFVRVVDLYGQIYVQRDIGIRRSGDQA